MTTGRTELACGCISEGGVAVAVCQKHLLSKAVGYRLVVPAPEPFTLDTEHLSTCSTVPPSADSTDKLFALELDPDPDEES